MVHFLKLSCMGYREQQISCQAAESHMQLWLNVQFPPLVNESSDLLKRVSFHLIVMVHKRQYVKFPIVLWAFHFALLTAWQAKDESMFFFTSLFMPTNQISFNNALVLDKT